jgi:membrane protein required for colicin V production
MDMSNLNFVDFIILAIFFASTLLGFGRGLVSELISLATLIVALIIATLFASPLASVFTSSPPVQSAVNQAATAGVNAAQHVSYLAIGISFTLLFVGILIIGAIFGYIIGAAFQAGLMGLGNRFMGGIFGLARGFLINLVLIFLVQLSPFGNSSSWLNSSLVNAYQPSVQNLGSLISPSLAQLKSKVEQGIQSMNAQLQGIFN